MCDKQITAKQWSRKRIDPQDNYEIYNKAAGKALCNEELGNAIYVTQYLSGDSYWYIPKGEYATYYIYDVATGTVKRG